MALVTYLFGAGASANALPVVNQISMRIYGVIDRLKESEIKDKDALKVVKDDLEWLASVIATTSFADPSMDLVRAESYMPHQECRLPGYRRHHFPWA